jgi:hypothetical protein
MDEADAYAPPGSPLPTVAHDRAHGITSLIVLQRGYSLPAFEGIHLR